MNNKKTKYDLLMDFFNKLFSTNELYNSEKAAVKNEKIPYITKTFLLNNSSNNMVNKNCTKVKTCVTRSKRRFRNKT